MDDATTSADPVPSPSVSTRILVLEDDDAHAELIRRGFKRGVGVFELIFANSLREAHTIIRQSPPDLIIADWLLPDGKGIDILQQQGHITIPVIIMTSHGNENLAVELMKSGAIDYIVKSDFSFRELPHTVTRTLREWNGMRERQNMDRALLQQRETLASILNAITEAVFLMTPEGTIIEANETTAVRLGARSTQDLIGNNAWKYVPPAIADFCGERVADVVKTGKPVHFEDMWDGRIRANTLFPIKGPAGTVKQIAVCAMDITERKQAEQALELARRKLNLLNTVTFQDIQSLVFSASAYINMAKMSNDPDKIKEYLEREYELVRQISGCLDFTQNYQDLGLNAPRWQKIGDVVIYAISHLNFSGIEKTVNLDNLEVYADPLLEKAMVHIIQNIIEGAGRTTAVSISCLESDAGITISLRGDNAGVPADEKEILFQHSFGGHRGLGLFLAREILSITGLTIRETGKPGTCTCFEIRIPRGEFRSCNE